MTRQRILSHVIGGYMLLALSWWTVLLLQKNHEVFEIQQIAVAENPQMAHIDITQLDKDYRRQRNMIIGEGIVFIVALFIGIWLINRGYTQEITAIRQKRNFLLAITHELKSPLASIRIILETFARRKELKEDDRTNLMNNALTETDRLKGLIDNLLLAARLDKSYQPVFEELDISDLMQKVITDLGNIYPSRTISLGKIEKGVVCRADKIGLYSMIYNLAENALKYSAAQYPICLEAAMTTKEVTIRVIDQGIGIPDSEKKKIFDQFYRVGNEEVRGSTGTGLGLYIVSKLVALHQGRIEVMDNKPTGTIFLIGLPRNPVS